ncbi:MAG: hypothetical protein CME64_06480 [Halobacteriovoraceae bacterium]|nr:hypothetical protein [Halobacteriovoraceae bacterium]
MEKRIQFLRVFLYHFLNLDEVTPNFPTFFINYMESNYSLEERKEILSSLTWALNQKDLNFPDLLRGITISNVQIKLEIEKVLQLAQP